MLFKSVFYFFYLFLRTWHSWSPPSWTHLTPLTSMMLLLILSWLLLCSTQTHLLPCSLPKIHSSLFTAYNPFWRVFTQSYSIRSSCSSSVHPQKIPVYMPKGTIIAELLEGKRNSSLSVLPNSLSFYLNISDNSSIPMNILTSDLWVTFDFSLLPHYSVWSFSCVSSIQPLPSVDNQ